MLVVATASSTSASEGVVVHAELVSEPEWGWEVQQVLASPGGPIEDVCLQRQQVKSHDQPVQDGRATERLA